MIEVVTGVLKRKRKESAIKFELFTASSHENVIQDLRTYENYRWWMTKKLISLKCRKNKPYLKPPKTRVRCSLLLPRRICSSCLARGNIRNGRNGKNLIHRWK
jgi:ring-1,2-phenylacetyl-CoA epoxidase subunit PaaE